MNQDELILLLNDKEQFAKRVPVEHSTSSLGKKLLSIGGTLVVLNLFATIRGMMDEEIDASYFFDIFFQINFEYDPIFSGLLIASGAFLVLGVILFLLGRTKNASSIDVAHEQFIDNPKVVVYNVLTVKKVKIVLIAKQIESQKQMENAFLELIDKNKKLVSKTMTFASKQLKETAFITYINKLFAENEFYFEVEMALVVPNSTQDAIGFVIMNNSLKPIKTDVIVDGVGEIELQTTY